VAVKIITIINETILTVSSQASQEIGWQDCIWNDQLCVNWDAKPYPSQLSY